MISDILSGSRCLGISDFRYLYPTSDTYLIVISDCRIRVRGRAKAYPMLEIYSGCRIDIGRICLTTPHNGQVK